MKGASEDKLRSHFLQPTLRGPPRKSHRRTAFRGMKPSPATSCNFETGPSTAQVWFVSGEVGPASKYCCAGLEAIGSQLSSR